MNRLIRFLLYMYIIVASWTLAYRVGSWFTIPNIIVLLIIPLYLLWLIRVQKVKIAIYRSEDLFLIVSIVFLMLSYLINGGNFNYIFAYLFTFGMSYLLMKQIYYQFGNAQKVLKINAMATLFIAVFIILEFLCQYFFRINIRSMLNFGVVPEATYLRIFHRSYGFSTEPTNLGYYLNALGPIGLWNWYNSDKIKKTIKIAITAIFFLGWITTLSAATFISLSISAFFIGTFTFFTNLRKKFSKEKLLFISLIVISTMAIMLVSVMVFDTKDLITPYLEPIVNKISIIGIAESQESALSGRYSRWVRDFERFKENPMFGYGPGSTTIYYGSSSVNWYLNLLVENGIFAFLSINIFFFVSFIRIAKSQIHNKKFFLVGFTSSLIHLISFSTFYDPAIWVLLIMFHIYAEKINLNQVNRRGL